MTRQILPNGRPAIQPCLAYAAAAVALALLFQFLMVRYHYEGNWTALFFTGEYLTTPPVLAQERIYLHPNTWGYDAQFYHYLAHDPLLREGLSQYLDDARLRWRRILVPALAHLAAAGEQRFVDAAYFAVTLAFLFLGVYWVSRYCAWHGRHPAWGLVFLLVPGVMISIERLTVDLALVALCAGFAVYTCVEPSWKIYPILALAPLVRETGVLLVGAYVLFLLLERLWGRALQALLCCLPFLAWVWFVHQNTAPDPTKWSSFYPLSGILTRTLKPVAYWITGPAQVAAAVLDYIAVIGVWLAFILGIRLLLTRELRPIHLAGGVFIVFAAFLDNSKIWAETYAFGRHLSPLLLWLAMEGVATGSRWLFAPACLVIPRVAAQVATHAPAIVSEILGR